jgi:hypothetical protein
MARSPRFRVAEPRSIDCCLKDFDHVDDAMQFFEAVKIVSLGFYDQIHSKCLSKFLVNHFGAVSFNNTAEFPKSELNQAEFARFPTLKNIHKTVKKVPPQVRYVLPPQTPHQIAVRLLSTCRNTRKTTHSTRCCTKSRNNARHLDFSESK